jgi:hypothetical protein
MRFLASENYIRTLGFQVSFSSGLRDFKLFMPPPLGALSVTLQGLVRPYVRPEIGFRSWQMF